MIRTTEMKCIFSLRWFFRFCFKVMNPALNDFFYQAQMCPSLLISLLYALRLVKDIREEVPSPHCISCIAIHSFKKKLWLCPPHHPVFTDPRRNFCLVTSEGTLSFVTRTDLSYMERPLYELANDSLAGEWEDQWVFLFNVNPSTVMPCVSMFFNKAVGA